MMLVRPTTVLALALLAVARRGDQAMPLNPEQKNRLDVVTALAKGGLTGDQLTVIAEWVIGTEEPEESDSDADAESSDSEDDDAEDDDAAATDKTAAAPPA